MNTQSQSLICPDTGYLYLHGFLSSSASTKAQQTIAFFADHNASSQLRTPDLSFDSQDAILEASQHILELQRTFKRITIIGSSLGGYYATYLLHQHHDTSTPIRAVLINPAVKPYRLFEGYLGPLKHYYNGETYELTPEHIERVKAYDTDPVRLNERILTLLQTGDETLDYRHAVEHYGLAHCHITQGGDHSYQQFERMLPSIIEFAQR